MILGITGGTGCGKTTLLQLIQQRGGLVLDCDEIYHQLLISDRALLEALHQRFPLAFSDGSFDRKKLGSIVFADARALSDLNAITHSAIRQEVERRLEDAPPLAAIDAIGLFESGLNRLCDLTVAVTAPEEVRVQRLMQRDSISPEYARSRIAAQPSARWFAERCDAVLENNGTAEEFRKKSIAFLDSHGIIKTVCSG
jgi:dephospho-coA kinase